MNFINKDINDFFKPAPVEEPKPAPVYKIFCDLNGVLTGFDERFEHYTGMEPQVYKQMHGSGPFWNLINNQIGDNFWKGLGWTPQGKELWNLIKNHNPVILSSPSKNNYSVEGKTSWVDKHLGNVELVFCGAQRKHEYCKETFILIDDRQDVIRKWKSQGGIGLHCKNNNLTPVINDLKQLGFE